MGKLHELLAVEKDQKNLTNKIIAEGKDTFGKKHDHFTGSTKIYEPFNDDDSHEAEALSEFQEIVTTVDNKLNYIFEQIIKSIDITFQKDATNKTAFADIEIDGEVIIPSVPATTLLSLEEYLREIRDLCQYIPTMAPGVKWELDESLGDNIYRIAHLIVKIRTKKETVYKSVAKATDRHPEQIVSEVQDVPVGKYTETKYSGMYTPAQKSELLARIDKLLSSVKKARARANEAVTIDSVIAKKLIDYIMSK